MLLSGLLFHVLHNILSLFKTGVLFVSFHSIGALPSCIDKLNVIAGGILLSTTISTALDMSRLHLVICYISLSALSFFELSMDS